MFAIFPRRFRLRTLLIVVAVAACCCADIANARRLASLPRTGRIDGTITGYFPDYNGLDDYSRLITLAPFAAASLLVGFLLLIRRATWDDRRL